MSTAATMRPLEYVQRGQFERLTMVDVASMNTPPALAANVNKNE